MTRSRVYVGLVRGINVGGRAIVAMSDLRALIANLGYRDVRTLLQSGNVVFGGNAKDAAAVEAELEKEALRRFGRQTAFLVRSPDQLAAVIADNPFPNEAKHDPGHLIVMFLKSPPDAKAVETLSAAVIGPETIRAGSRHLYITYPDGMGSSKLTGALIEKKLGTAGSARNWNTILKLAALAAGAR